MRTEEHDYEEFADRINGLIDIGSIETRQDYLEAIDEVLGKRPSSKQFAILWRSKGTQIKIYQQKLFKKAEGIDLAADKRKNAKTIVSDIDKYRELGARRSDLRGLDTRRVFGYTKVAGVLRRRKIDETRTKIVKYPAQYQRKIKGKLVTVNIKKRERIFVYDKKGKRLKLRR